MELARLRAVVFNIGEDYIRLREKVAEYEEHLNHFRFDFSGITELSFEERPAQGPGPDDKENDTSVGA